MRINDEDPENKDELNNESTVQEKPMRGRLVWFWDHAVKDKAAGWQAISAVVITIFTILLYFVANSTNETSRATQRAVVSFSGTGSGQSLSSPDRKTRIAQEVLFNWNNSGVTQARNAITAISGEAWPTELPKGFDFPDLQNNSKQFITLGPKETSGVRAQIPVGDFATTWSAKSHLYAWGWIVYDDVFKGDPTHLTEFCVELIQISVPEGKAGTDISDPAVNFGWNVQRCQQHNCYDEECKDYSTRIKQARAE